jgi:pseudouridylate synthase
MDLRIAPDVSQAMLDDRPVVALESTVIAQGLPWPDNLETARAMESAVRSSGATPATIAVLDGVIHVGISESGWSVLASGDPLASARHLVAKANRRDLAVAVAMGRNAATTVSATLFLANRYRLEPRVMATGGLGGVHRGAATNGDVSTDLDELARANGALVVCSGFKSILDLPMTLEALETRGVLVVGYQTNELPGFLTRSSGLPLEHHVDSPAQAVDLVRAHRRLELPGAIVLVQPVPAQDSVAPLLLAEAIENALSKARAQGVAGKQVTPFLLAAVRDATSGQGLMANRSLLIENARLAGRVAAALAALPD